MAAPHLVDAEIRAYIDDLLPKALAAGWNSYEVVNWHKSCRGIWDIVTEPRPAGEHIPTPDNAPDPLRDASLNR